MNDLLNGETSTQPSRAQSNRNTGSPTQLKTENFEYQLRLLRQNELSLLRCEKKPLTPFLPQTFVFILDATSSMNQFIDDCSRFDTLMKGIKMTIEKLMPEIKNDLFRQVTIIIKTFNHRTKTILHGELTEDLAMRILSINKRHGLEVYCGGVTNLNLVGDLVNETRAPNTTIIGATDGQHTIRNIDFKPGAPCDYMIGIGRPDYDYDIKSLKKLTNPDSVLIASTASDLSSSILGLFNSFRPSEELQAVGQTLYHLPLGNLSYTLFIGDDLVTIGSTQYQLKPEKSDLVKYFKEIKELQELIAKFEKDQPTPTEIQCICSQFGIKTHLLKQRNSEDPDEKRILTMFYTLRDRLQNIYRQAFIKAYGFDCGGVRPIQKSNIKQVMVSAIDRATYFNPDNSSSIKSSNSKMHSPSLETRESLSPDSSPVPQYSSPSPLNRSPIPLSTPQISINASQRMTEAVLMSAVTYQESPRDGYHDEFNCAICLCGFFDLSTAAKIRTNYSLPVPEPPYNSPVTSLSQSFVSYSPSRASNSPSLELTSSILASDEVEIPSLSNRPESPNKEIVKNEPIVEKVTEELLVNQASYDLMARFVDLEHHVIKSGRLQLDESVEMEIDSQSTVELKADKIHKEDTKLCRHLFHTKCFKRWAHSIHGSPTCPICRTTGGKMELLISPPNGRCISCQVEVPNFYCLSCKKLAYCKDCVKDEIHREGHACCNNQVKFSEIRLN